MAGGAPRPLVEDVVWACADWDPNGKGLALVRQTGGAQQLEFPIGKVIVPQGAYVPRFSPDGREIAFWKEDRGGYKLSLVDRDGGPVTTLSSGWKSATGVPGWNADGREVWFTASKTGETESLWAVGKSGDPRLLTRVPGTLELYDVARDGRVLLGHHTLIQSLRGLAPGQSTEVELAWLDGSAPSDLSADGTTLLITETGEGAGSGPAIYLRTTDGAPAARIGEGDGIALSPDKKWVLARREESGRRHFVLIPTGAGQVRPLALDGLNVGAGAFTPDAQRIVFTAGAETGPPQLYVADVAGGKPRPIGPPGMGIQQMSSAVSPDGRWVVGVRRGKLVVISIDGAGEPRELPNLQSPRDRAAQWTADSRSVYVYDQSSRPLKVEICDVETGQKRPWKEIPLDESLAQVRLRLTPDGRSYAYGARSAFSELYLVEGLR